MRDRSRSHLLTFPGSLDTWHLLQQEIATQTISDYRVWEGIVDTSLHLTSPGAYEFYLANRPENFDLYLAGIVYGNSGENNTTSIFRA